MKTVSSFGSVSQIPFQAEADAPKCKISPRNFVRVAKFDFQAFLSSQESRVGHSPSIKQMNLIDMGNADHGKWRINDDICAGFFLRFSYRRIGGGFAVFHEAGWQCPEAKARLNGASA
ncbi:MAG: hypothetical protein H6R14_2067 [Proteobacteria bacterium]|nr:hypothetical protein [Pseudomonadota bacterium]